MSTEPAPRRRVEARAPHDHRYNHAMAALASSIVVALSVAAALSAWAITSCERGSNVRGLGIVAAVVCVTAGTQVLVIFALETPTTRGHKLPPGAATVITTETMTVIEWQGLRTTYDDAATYSAARRGDLVVTVDSLYNHYDMLVERELSVDYTN